MIHSNFVALIGHMERLNWYAFVFIFFAIPIAAMGNNCPDPVNLACDDQLNLSIPNGAITIEVGMVAENLDPTCYPDYTVNIYNNGVHIGNEITCTFSGQILEYSIVHISTGLSCWGNILIEDKAGPVISCTDIDIACSQNSSVDTLGTPEVFDNCDSNPSLVHQDNLVDYNCNNPNYLSTIQRTWSATDSEGNTSSCIQNINILRPDISSLSFPDNITISCEDGNIDNSNTGGPSVADMLSGMACNFVVYFEDTETPVCTGTKKIIRSWYVTDWCTGDEQSDTQIIVVEDTLGPMIACPADLTIGANENTCSATITLPEATATDACSNVTSIRPSWDFGAGNIEYPNIPLGDHSVLYTATDDCGNTSTCTMMVSVIDDVVPVAICDLNTSVSIGVDQASEICADDIDSGSYDNCELASRAIRIAGDPNYAECITLSCAQVGQTLTVEMQVVDIHGLENHCTVAVEVFDKIAPVISSCATDITISCDEDVNDLSITGMTTATDNCQATVTYTDFDDLNECNVGEIIRTFTAIDDFGNSSTCTQNITLEDNTQPVIQFSEDITLVCVDNNDEIGKPIVEDNCGRFAFNFVDVDIQIEECIQIFERTWEVLNICTDERYSESLDITLENDTNLPQFSGAPVEITAACNDFVPAFIDPLITDECDNDLSIEIQTTDTPGVCPVTRILTKTYTATDDCGNTNSFTQTIRLIDNVSPVFVNFPADQTINCDETINVELPVIADNCDANPTITFVNDTIPGDCLNEILVFRTYTAEDRCGNTNVAIQLFRFVDNVAPVIRGQSSDLLVPCDFQIPVFDLGAIDNCDNDLEIVITDTSVPGDCPNEEFVTRIYSVIDDCGNVTRDTVLVEIVDLFGPELEATNLVENLTIDCDQAFPVINFITSDNCDVDIEITESRDTTGNPCNLSVLRTFTATDDCGNATQLTQNINVIDDEPPFFASFPQNQDVTIFSGESVQVDVIDAMVIDNCSSDNDVNFEIDFFSDGDQTEIPNIFVDGNNASGVYPLGVHTISFSTADDCGNTLDQDLIISVVDFSPSASCTDITLEIGENGLLLVEPSNVLQDPDIINDPEIANIQFVNPSNFTDVIGQNLLFACSNLGINQFAIEVIMTNGESTICSNLINLIDPDDTCESSDGGVGVAGKISDLRGTPMKNVEILMNARESEKYITDQYGIYAFDNIPMGSTCEIAPYYDHDPAQNVTTFDMVLIMQHILRLQALTNPYQHIAADVNLDNNIDILDLLEIRNLILHQIDHFSISPSHRFIERDYQFANPENPLLEYLPDSHLCESLDENRVGLDYIMIKMGDIDGTLVDDFAGMIEQRTSYPLQLHYQDSEVVANEMVTVKIKAELIKDIAGLQFAIRFVNTNHAEINAPAALKGNYFQKKDIIHFAWTKFDEALSEEFFELQFKSKTNGKVSDFIQLLDEKTATYFDNQGAVYSVNLLPQESLVGSKEMMLEQNTPNPFKDFTDINFFLTKAGTATISVMDMAGKTIFQQQQMYLPGWHRHRFESEQLSPGIYIYTLVQGKNSQSKKMVITR